MAMVMFLPLEQAERQAAAEPATREIVYAR